jgi:hypothetical protein
MKRFITDKTGPARRAQHGGTRAILLPLIFFLLGIGLSAFWFYHGKLAEDSKNQGVQLSEKTRTLLQHLGAPVEIRFYSLLPASTASESLRAFAQRVDALLAAMRQESGGQLKVTQVNEPSDAHANAAVADGVPAFNLDKGDACFLGIALVCKDRKESFPQLQVDWEPALEYDLDRALERVTAGQQAPPPGPLLDSKSSAEAISDVARLIPNVNAISLEDGVRILRDASMKDFAAAAAEMENQIKAAQQALSDAQQGKPEAEQQAAMKELQKVQLEQADKIKQIAAQLQSRLAVFQQLKTGPPPSGVK